MNGPGLFWLLIIMTLFLLALAIRILEKNAVVTVPVTTPTQEVIGPADDKPARVYNVSYKGGVFSPTNLRIHAGDTVRFKNDGFFSIRIVSDPDVNNMPGLDSIGEIPQGSYFSFTFGAKGIFGYYNYNNQNEKGTIIVR